MRVRTRARTRGAEEGRNLSQSSETAQAAQPSGSAPSSVRPHSRRGWGGGPRSHILDTSPRPVLGTVSFPPGDPWVHPSILRWGVGGGGGACAGLRAALQGGSWLWRGWDSSAHGVPVWVLPRVDLRLRMPEASGSEPPLSFPTSPVPTTPGSCRNSCPSSGSSSNSPRVVLVLFPPKYFFVGIGAHQYRAGQVPGWGEAEGGGGAGRGGEEPGPGQDWEPDRRTGVHSRVLSPARSPSSGV